ncbi:MAG: chorismate--pyruvate lyase [Arenicella sp.]|jgi:chorismate--pyruvate lyase
MDKSYKALATHSNWWPDNALSIAKIDSKLVFLACEKGSLTAALVALSDQNFSVKVVRQRIARPYFHEQLKLNRPLSRGALIREVELQLYGESVVFARSIIPLSLITNSQNGLANLGQTPLGHLLFKNGKIRVSKRQFSRPSHTMTTDKQCTVSARRTPYDYQGSQILVSEFFLPQIYKYLE